MGDEESGYVGERGAETYTVVVPSGEKRVVGVVPDTDSADLMLSGERTDLPEDADEDARWETADEGLQGDSEEIVFGEGAWSVKVTAFEGRGGEFRLFVR